MSVAETLPPGLHHVGALGWVLVLPGVVDFLPLVLPEASRRLNLAIIAAALRRALMSLPLQDPTLISYWWMFPEISKWDVWIRAVFEVIDRHWDYEHMSHRGARRNLALVVATAKGSSKVTAVSPGIADSLREWGVDAVVIPNAIPVSRINRALRGGVVRENKRAVYVGGWNSRIDRGLVREIVTGHPDWTFVFGGCTRPPAFEGLANCDFLGPISYDDAVKLMASAQVGLVPFVRNAFTESSNFLKVLDYLACGAVVMASDLSSLRDIADRFPERVYLLERPEHWHQLLAAGLESPPPLGAAELEAWSTDRRATRVVS